MGKYENLIVEMLERIIKLEKEVEKLKGEQPNGHGGPPPVREEKPLFVFNNKKCTRAKLVLEVIKKYVSEHGCNYEDLSRVFPKELQGFLNVVVIPDPRISINKEYYDLDNPILILDGNCYVCKKWWILNIERFIDKAYELGYRVERIWGEVWS